jgi:RNA polymerase sigma-70 factor (ECF subfamily)
VLDLDVHLPGIAAGDPVAFAAWVAGGEHSLRGSLRTFAARVDVEAVLQETLLRAWQVAHRLRPDGKANALLRLAARTARNLAVSEARRRGPVPGLDDEAFDTLLDGLARAGPAPPDPFLRRAIQACAQLLPPKPREALLARLAAAGGDSDQDIAAGLGVRLNTLLQNVTRARRALAECLQRRGVSLAEELP